MILIPIIPTTTGNPNRETIEAFYNGVITELDRYFSELIDEERLGSPNIVDRRMVAIILVSYVEILRNYFANNLYDDDDIFITDYNFMTVDEVQALILKINHICGSNLYIHLEATNNN